MDGLVGFLAFGAAVMQDVSATHGTWRRIGGRLLTTTRRQLVQLDLPMFLQLVPSGLQLAHGSEGVAMISDVGFGDLEGKGRQEKKMREKKWKKKWNTVD